MAQSVLNGALAEFANVTASSRTNATESVNEAAGVPGCRMQWECEGDHDR